jgi:DNA-binding NarL/FixJ family response regulator
VSAPHAAILIVEDHPLYQQALLGVLREIGNGRNVLLAQTAEQGLATMRAAQPLRLVVLDLGLPGLSGTSAIREYRRLRPQVPLLVVSATDSPADAAAAIQAGALGFISKAARAEDLRAGLARALQGQLPEQERITLRPGGWMGHPPPCPADALVVLTPRQQETLELLLRGYSNKEIALHMGLAEITVKVHISSIFKALGVVNRTQAALAARRLGLAADGPMSAVSRSRK